MFSVLWDANLELVAINLQLSNLSFKVSALGNFVLEVLKSTKINDAVTQKVLI